MTRTIRTQTAVEDLILTRVFEAPIERVWAMWSEAEHLQHWFHPGGCTPVNPRFDVRPGGSYACDFQMDDGPLYRVRGRFESLTPPTELVFTHGWANEDGSIECDTRVVVTLEAQGAATKVTVVQSGLPNEAERTGHGEGWSQALDHLGRRLTAKA